MIFDGILRGDSIYLRDIKLDDCNECYVGWMNNPEINKYLESRFDQHNLASVEGFATSLSKSEDNYFFAICTIDKNQHIGNMRIGPISAKYRNAYLGYIVGEKEYWGRGVATQAILLATEFCFDILKLNKVNAGVIGGNIGSQRALEKAGFALEGSFREEMLLDDEYVDSYRYGITRKDFLKINYKTHG